MTQIKILKAKPEDAKGIAEVYYKTWLNTYPNKQYNIIIEDIKYKYKNRNNKEELLKKEERIRQTPKNIKRFVAKEGKKIIGLCHITIDKEYNQLNSIYILPKYQGKGIGKMFWKKCQKHFNPENKTIVYVASYNSNAITFYKNRGFIKTGKIIINKTHKMKNGAIIPEIKMILKPQIQKNNNKLNNKKISTKIKKTAIIIHGWDCDINVGWFKWIKMELIKKGYNVFIPQMPNPKYPEIKPWVKTLKSYEKYIDENTLLIGYSIGCQTIIRYLEQSNKKVHKVIFVAGWFDLKKDSYKIHPHLEKELRAMVTPWITTKIDLKNVKNKINTSTAIFSTNDVYVPIEESKKFEKGLGSKIIIQKNKGHFQEGKTDKIPVLLKEI